MKINKETYQFYKDYILAIERDKTWWGRILNRFSDIDLKIGLCDNHWDICSHHIPMYIPTKYYALHGTSGYPFGGGDLYRSEVNNKTLHKNPHRLAFVRDMIKLYEENKQ